MQQGCVYLHGMGFASIQHSSGRESGAGDPPRGIRHAGRGKVMGMHCSNVGIIRTRLSEAQALQSDCLGQLNPTN